MEAATGRMAGRIDDEACSWCGSWIQLAPPYLADFRERLRMRLGTA